jgi:hypothetical protein
MEQDYRLESLTSTFIVHSEDIERDRIRVKNQIEESDPDDDEFNAWLEDFNIAKALSVMCWEIERLKNFVGMK